MMVQNIEQQLLILIHENQYILYVCLKFIHVQYLHSQQSSKYNSTISWTLSNHHYGRF
jgi:hypothetical protein